MKDVYTHFFEFKTALAVTDVTVQQSHESDVFEASTTVSLSMQSCFFSRFYLIATKKILGVWTQKEEITEAVQRASSASSLEAQVPVKSYKL